MATNVLALAPRRCVMLEGSPVTRSLLEEAGCEVRTYRGDELSLKAEGGTHLPYPSPVSATPLRIPWPSSAPAPWYTGAGCTDEGTTLGPSTNRRFQRTDARVPSIRTHPGCAAGRTHAAWRLLQGAPDLEPGHGSRAVVSSTALRFVLVVAAAAGLLALAAGPALAADGVPVLPINWSGTQQSQTNPAVSSSGSTAVAAWEQTPWTPPEQPAFTGLYPSGGFQPESAHRLDASPRRVSRHPGGAGRSHGPRLRAKAGAHRLHAGRSHSFRTARRGPLDLGGRQPRARRTGFPASSHPGSDLQSDAAVRPLAGPGVRAHGKHIVLAWEDTRDNGPSAPQVYMLDLSRDSNGNGTPDYREPGFDPKTAGVRGDLRHHGPPARRDRRLQRSVVGRLACRHRLPPRPHNGRRRGRLALHAARSGDSLTASAYGPNQTRPLSGSAYISSLRPTTIGGAWLAHGKLGRQRLGAAGHHARSPRSSGHVAQLARRAGHQRRPLRAHERAQRVGQRRSRRSLLRPDHTPGRARLRRESRA